jgi:hypothetical protein
MSHEIIEIALRGLRARVSEAIKSLHDLVQRTSNPELAQNVSELRERIQEPFMFVIVGEVKSGKSSFINALLNTGTDICKVAPDPCTDTIQQVLYGDEQVVVINEYLKKIYHPVEILREIAIVDTPGTNTIIQHHQQITERFIPVSDLIVFVFEAKNPYRQSAWEFFDYISAEWRKKVIFVLQQADLMEPDDLKINMQGVTSQAEKKGVNQPQVFSVSAKQAMAGDIAGSGMGAIIDYINANVTGGRAPWLKLENNLSTAKEISNRIGTAVDARSKQLQEDQNFRAEVTETLQTQGGHSKKQVRMLVENMIAAYDRITNEAEKDLSRGLNFFTLIRRSFLSIFTKKESATGWLTELTEKMETSLKKELTIKVNEGVVSVADSIQQMAKIIQLKIQNSKTILKGDQGIFADISERRVQVMHDLQQAFSEFLNRTENFVDERMIPKDSQFTPDLAKGGGLAIIGVVMATVTKSMAFDITGGILSAIGILFAGITVGIKRQKVLNSFTHEVARGRQALEDDISTKLVQYVDTIERRIDQNFLEFDAMIQLEETETSQLTKNHLLIDNQLSDIEKELKNQVQLKASSE